MATIGKGSEPVRVTCAWVSGAFLASLILVGERARAAVDEVSLAAAVRGIQLQEAAAPNISAVGDMEMVKWDEKKKDWVDGGELHYGVVYGGDGRRRIESRRSLTPWIQGDGEFYLDSSVTTFDGKTSSKLISEYGNYLKPGKADRLEVKVGSSIERLANWSTGWGFSVFGINDDLPPGSTKRSPRFSKFLLGASKEAGFVSKEVLEGGKQLLSVQTGAGTPVVITYTLDPARSYAIVRYASDTKFGGDMKASRSVTWEVKAFTEPVSGVFYPRRVEVEIQDVQGAQVEHEKRTLNVSAVKVLEKVGAEMFTIKVPNGTNIEDPSRREMWVITGTDGRRAKEVEKIQGAVVEKARREEQ